MLNRFFPWFLTILFSQVGFAEHDTYPEKHWHFKLGAETPNYNIRMTKGGEDESELNFMPNLPPLTYLGVSYKDWLGLAVGIKSPLPEGSQELKGQSSYRNLRLNFAQKSFFTGIHYSEFRGFYLDNSQALNPDFEEGDVYFQYPSMYTRSWGLHFTWVWSYERFSIAALVNQTVRQTESGGSIIFGGNIGEATVSNPNGLIPFSLRSDYGDQGNLVDGDFLTAHMKGGYGYSFVSTSTKWHIGGYLMLGAGLQKSRLENLGGEVSNEWKVSPRLDMLMSGGYNGDDFFAGMSLMGGGDYYTSSGLQIGVTEGTGMLFGGYHL